MYPDKETLKKQVENIRQVTLQLYHTGVFLNHYHKFLSKGMKDILDGTRDSVTSEKEKKEASMVLGEEVHAILVELWCTNPARLLQVDLACKRKYERLQKPNKPPYVSITEVACASVVLPEGTMTEKDARKIQRNSFLAAARFF